jgi:hypothetical protein
MLVALLPRSEAKTTYNCSLMYGARPVCLTLMAINSKKIVVSQLRKHSKTAYFVFHDVHQKARFF